MDYLRSLAARLRAAGHGQRGVIIAEAMQWLDVSKPTLYARLRSVGWTSNRKLRADKGDTRITEEAMTTVAALVRSSLRDNKTQGMPMTTAIDMALANGVLDEPVSSSTMLRVMRRHGIHPHQLARPAPHTAMRSEHPNHVWQLDASVCVLYYLRDGRPVVMDERKFNARKPAEIAKINTKRLLRYAVTDHASGAVIARYYNVPGEDQLTLFDFLMHAFGQQEGRVMHGVPKMLVWDAGSANTSHAITALLTGLGIVHWTHVPGNPRAKGQVEGVHNIIERQFETRLRCVRIESLEQLNAELETWLRVFNDVKIHSRHGHSRSAVWQTIRQEQLRLRPTVEVCQALSMSKPAMRTVKGTLTVEYTVKGFEPMVYSVEHVDGIRVGEKVAVVVNPYHQPSIFVVGEDAEGRTRYWECEPLAKNHLGFLEMAPCFGQEYKAPKDTATDTARRDVNELAYGERDSLEAIAVRNKGRLAFDGKMDAFKDLHEAAKSVPSHIQRRGTLLDVPNPVQVELRPLSVIEVLKHLHARLDRDITREESALVFELYPDGVPEQDLEALVERIANPAPQQRPRLSVVS
ncbi:MAG: hypothetical protein ACTHNM_17155 [Dyella sp.]|uniref:hypothetical protein n=1 Tax=Dyella sp. TaxID=1869338 RepID=UPI003F7EE9D3